MELTIYSEQSTPPPAFPDRIPPLWQSFVLASNATPTDVKEKSSQTGKYPILQGSPELVEAFGRAADHQGEGESSASVPTTVSSIVLSDIAEKEVGGDWESDEDDFGPNRPARHKMVCAWLQICTDDARPNFLEQKVPEHWTCDIDTNTGHLISPIDAPDTIIDPEDLKTDTAEQMAADFRRRNYNASLVAAKMRGGLKQMMDGFLSKHMENIATDSTPAELKPKEKPQSYHIPMVVAPPEPPKPKPAKNDFAPGVYCHFRPAREDDLDGICHIYNWEIRHGSQALDTLPLLRDDFSGILGNARNHDQPFVVAIEGRPPQPNHRVPSAKLESYRTPEPPMEKILGFAYLAPWNTGLGGNLEGSTRLTARLQAFVRDGYRRNNIGSCLVDKVMSAVSTSYQPKFKYQFIDPDKKPEYRRLQRGEKRHHAFYQLYINYFLKRAGQNVDDTAACHLDDSEGDEDLEWLSPLLADKFGFSLMPIRFSHVARTIQRPRREPAWYDMVVFEHSCQEDPDSIF